MTFLGEMHLDEVVKEVFQYIQLLKGKLLHTYLY